MDNRLLRGNKNAQLREILDRALASLNTGLPGVVVSFNADKRTCEVQPGIQMKINTDGVTRFEPLPLIVNAPVELPYVSVAGFYITLPIRPGDPCWIKFSQRAIDNWFAEGGIQPPGDGDAVGGRHHDLTDAVVSFAPSTLKDVLTAWETEGIELRNRAKTSRITLKDTTIEINVAGNSILVGADGTLTYTGVTGATFTIPEASFTGTVTVDGALASQTSVADPTGTLDELRQIVLAFIIAYNAHTHPDLGVPDPQAIATAP